MILIPLSIEKCIFPIWFDATPVPSDLLYSHHIQLTFGYSFCHCHERTYPNIDFLHSMCQIPYPFSLA
jgi:hypothetical protein